MGEEEVDENKNGESIKNGDLTIKNGDLTIKNGDLTIQKMVVWLSKLVLYNDKKLLVGGGVNLPEKIFSSMGIIIANIVWFIAHR